MKVTVKLLALYKDLLPPEVDGNECVLDLEAGDSFEVVLEKFNLPADNASVVLVNGRTPEPGQELKEGDVVCAFPAVAGGSH